VDTSGICKLVGVALHFKMAAQRYGMALIMANEHTDSSIFLLLKVKNIFSQCVSIACT